MPEEKETVAVVTGSSSGIGFGRILLEEDMNQIKDNLKAASRSS